MSTTCQQPSEVDSVTYPHEAERGCDLPKVTVRKESPRQKSRGLPLKHVSITILVSGTFLTKQSKASLLTLKESVRGVSSISVKVQRINILDLTVM